MCEFIVLPLLHKIKFLNSILEVILHYYIRKKIFNLGFIFANYLLKIMFWKNYLGELPCVLKTQNCILKTWFKLRFANVAWDNGHNVHLEIESQFQCLFQ